MLSLFSLLLLALPLASADHQAPDHRSLAKRAKGDVVKRTGASNARWTFYSTGLGACGGYNSDSDFIVALNQQTFGYSYPSPFCGKKISMSYGGKTTTATIVDSCPGCPGGGLDLSPGLFSFFASQDMGVIYGTWSIEGDSSGGGDDNDHTTTKKTTTHHTTSTTHTTPHTTSTTHTTTKTTSSTTSTTSTTSAAESTSSSSSSSASSSSHLPSSTASSNLAAQSGTVAAGSDAQPQNLYESSQVILNLMGVVVAGANAD